MSRYTKRALDILAKAQLDLWGNLSPQSNPDLMPKRVRAQRKDGTTYMTTVYVRRDTGEPATAPTLPTPQQQPIDFSQPAEPEQPAKPAKPAAPAEPKEPEKPVEPVEPEQPAEPEEPGDYDDVGEHIPGSRKELEALRLALQGRALELGDLDLIGTERGALSKMVTKAAVAGPDLKQQLRNSGLTPGAAYLWWKAWSSIAANPVPLYDSDDAPHRIAVDKRYDDEDFRRRVYAVGLRRVMDLIATPKDLDGMRAALNDLYSEANGGYLTPEQRARRDELAAARKETFDALVRYADGNFTGRARDLINYHLVRRWGGVDLSPTVPPNAAAAGVTQEQWLAAVEVAARDVTALRDLEEYENEARRENRESPLPMQGALLSLGQGFLKYTGYNTTDAQYRTLSRHRGEARNADRTNDWRWLEGGAGGGSGRKRKQKPKWERTGPDEVIREGGELREFTSEGLLETFGIRGVQYGNWMDEESSQEHTQRAGEAFLDLADIVGISPKQISLNGRLGMAFGARGKGGAKAHYEPAQTVINMTKEAGGGSLAHEWAHFLDNVLRRLLSDKPDDMKMLMDDVLDRKGNSYRYAYLFRNSGMEGTERVVTALGNLRGAIMQGDAREMRTIKVPRKHAYGAWRPGDEQLARYDGDVDVAFARYLDEKRADLESSRSWVADRAQKEIRNMAKYLGFKGKKDMEYQIPRGSRTSAYYATAKEMGEYWARPVELFARAFETWVQDELEKRDRKNTYLVSGIAKEEAAKWSAENPMDFQGGPPSPYPLGAERERINEAMGELMAALRDTGLLAKALMFTFGRPL